MRLSEMATYEEWMGLALEEAALAGQRGDVPVGAIIVVEDQVVARAGNRRRSDNDPTAHAEVLALRAASRVVGNWRVEGTLVVTQEPCPMCAGAIVNARVQRAVYGCPNPKAGAVQTLYKLLEDSRLNHRVDVVAGVRGDECSERIRGFFRALREQ